MTKNASVTNLTKYTQEEILTSNEMLVFEVLESMDVVQLSKQILQQDKQNDEVQAMIDKLQKNTDLLYAEIILFIMKNVIAKLKASESSTNPKRKDQYIITYNLRQMFRNYFFQPTLNKNGNQIKWDAWKLAQKPLNMFTGYTTAGKNAGRLQSGINEMLVVEGEVLYNLFVDLNADISKKDSEKLDWLLTHLKIFKKKEKKNDQSDSDAITVNSKDSDSESEDDFIFPLNDEDESHILKFDEQSPKTFSEDFYDANLEFVHLLKIQSYILSTSKFDSGNCTLVAKNIEESARNNFNTVHIMISHLVEESESVALVYGSNLGYMALVLAACTKFKVLAVEADLESYIFSLKTQRQLFINSESSSNNCNDGHKKCSTICRVPEPKEIEPLKRHDTTIECFIIVYQRDCNIYLYTTATFSNSPRTHGYYVGLKYRDLCLYCGDVVSNKKWEKNVSSEHDREDYFRTFAGVILMKNKYFMVFVNEINPDWNLSKPLTIELCTQAAQFSNCVLERSSDDEECIDNCVKILISMRESSDDEHACVTGNKKYGNVNFLLFDEKMPGAEKSVDMVADTSLIHDQIIDQKNSITLAIFESHSWSREGKEKMKKFVTMCHEFPYLKFIWTNLTLKDLKHFGLNPFSVESIIDPPLPYSTLILYKLKVGTSSSSSILEQNPIDSNISSSSIVLQNSIIFTLTSAADVNEKLEFAKLIETEKLLNQRVKSNRIAQSTSSSTNKVSQLATYSKSTSSSRKRSSRKSTQQISHTPQPVISMISTKNVKDFSDWTRLCLGFPSNISETDIDGQMQFISLPENQKRLTIARDRDQVPLSRKTTSIGISIPYESAEDAVKLYVQWTDCKLDFPKGCDDPADRLHFIKNNMNKLRKALNERNRFKANNQHEVSVPMNSIEMNVRVDASESNITAFLLSLSVESRALLKKLNDTVPISSNVGLQSTNTSTTSSTDVAICTDTNTTTSSMAIIDIPTSTDDDAFLNFFASDDINDHEDNTNNDDMQLEPSFTPLEPYINSNATNNNTSSKSNASDNNKRKSVSDYSESLLLLKKQKSSNNALSSATSRIENPDRMSSSSVKSTTSMIMMNDDFILPESSSLSCLKAKYKLCTSKINLLKLSKKVKDRIIEEYTKDRYNELTSYLWTVFKYVSLMKVKVSEKKSPLTPCNFYHNKKTDGYSYNYVNQLKLLHNNFPFKQLLYIDPDGKCFYRTIAYHVFGDQDEYITVIEEFQKLIFSVQAEVEKNFGHFGLIIWKQWEVLKQYYFDIFEKDYIEKEFVPELYGEGKSTGNCDGGYTGGFLPLIIASIIWPDKKYTIMNWEMKDGQFQWCIQKNEMLFNLNMLNDKTKNIPPEKLQILKQIADNYYDPEPFSDQPYVKLHDVNYILYDTKWIGLSGKSSESGEHYFAFNQHQLSQKLNYTYEGLNKSWITGRGVGYYNRTIENSIQVAESIDSKEINDYFTASRVVRANYQSLCGQIVQFLRSTSSDDTKQLDVEEEGNDDDDDDDDDSNNSDNNSKNDHDEGNNSSDGSDDDESKHSTHDAMDAENASSSFPVSKVLFEDVEVIYQRKSEHEVLFQNIHLNLDENNERSELYKLGPYRWINDNNSIAWCKFIEQKYSNSQVYIFDSHVLSYHKNQVQKSEVTFRKGYRIDKEKLKSIEYFVFPINYINTHWFLVIVEVKTRTLRVYDSLGIKNPNSKKHKKIFRGCASVVYQLYEYYHYNPELFEPFPEKLLITTVNDYYYSKDWYDKCIKTIVFTTEEYFDQGNGYDCGICMCRAIEHFVKNKNHNIRFDVQDCSMTKYRKRMRSFILSMI